MAVWRHPEGLESNAAQVGEQNATAKGTQEEVWAHRKTKAPLLGRVKGGGADHHRYIFPCSHGLSEIGVSLAQAMCDEVPLV